MTQGGQWEICVAVELIKEDPVASYILVWQVRRSGMIDGLEGCCEDQQAFNCLWMFG
jgi:hypothetical protein